MTALAQVHRTSTGPSSTAVARFRSLSTAEEARVPALRRATGNFLLDALPDDVWERLVSNLVPVSMSAGQVLREAGAVIRDAYFPASSIVSKLFLMEDGSTSGVALVGREGMVGVSLFLGSGRSQSQAQVQKSGQGFKLSASGLRAEFGRGGAMMQVLLRYTQSLIEQMMQTAACNRHGTLEQRLCRWLALSLDRSSSDELELTHESIAMTLGVWRGAVTEAAGRLQRQGVIRYRRGHISVLDRLALDRRVCECYPATEREPARSGRAPMPSDRPIVRARDGRHRPHSAPAVRSERCRSA